MRLLVAEWVSNLEFLTQLLLSLLLKLVIKNTIQTLCLQFRCDISSAEVQQGLALSASLLTSSKVPYYGFPLQRRVGSSYIASQKLAPDRNELLNPGSSSDNLSETDMYIYKDFAKSVVGKSSIHVNVRIPILCLWHITQRTFADRARSSIINSLI